MSCLKETWGVGKFNSAQAFSYEELWSYNFTSIWTIFTGYYSSFHWYKHILSFYLCLSKSEIFYRMKPYLINEDTRSMVCLWCANINVMLKSGLHITASTVQIFLNQRPTCQCWSSPFWSIKSVRSYVAIFLLCLLFAQPLLT